MKKSKKTLLALLSTAILSSSLAMTSAQAISRPEDLDITDITHLQKGIAGLVIGVILIKIFEKRNMKF